MSQADELIKLAQDAPPPRKQRRTSNKKYAGFGEAAELLISEKGYGSIKSCVDFFIDLGKWPEAKRAALQLYLQRFFENQKLSRIAVDAEPLVLDQGYSIEQCASHFIREARWSTKRKTKLMTFLSSHFRELLPAEQWRGLKGKTQAPKTIKIG